MHAKVLRYFIEVVRAGSIRKAAEQLHVVPTAVNRQILNLEEELGAPLFERIHNKLKLTPIGEIVLAHARATLRDFDAVRQHIEAVRGLRQGEASLATTTGLAGAFLPGIVQRCRAAHPGIHLKLLDLPIAGVLRAVAEGDAELALAYDVPETTGLRTLFASEWPLGAVVPPGHALADRATTTLADCLGFPLILPAAPMSLLPPLRRERVAGDRNHLHRPDAPAGRAGRGHHPAQPPRCGRRRARRPAAVRAAARRGAAAPEPGAGDARGHGAERGGRVAGAARHRRSGERAGRALTKRGRGVHFSCTPGAIY
jgi:DNA-binding transcriptional LysR family regulator